MDSNAFRPTNDLDLPKKQPKKRRRKSGKKPGRKNRKRKPVKNDTPSESEEEVLPPVLRPILQKRRRVCYLRMDGIGLEIPKGTNNKSELKERMNLRFLFLHARDVFEQDGTRDVFLLLSTLKRILERCWKKKMYTGDLNCLMDHRIWMICRMLCLWGILTVNTSIWLLTPSKSTITGGDLFFLRMSIV